MKTARTSSVKEVTDENIQINDTDVKLGETNVNLKKVYNQWF